uniref:Uncharacterized protein n=1 Tax=Nelumbo nucifera TaxID=4432 RepID=A0A822YQQ2_NELNU|nr:TPA_asm: hypothetical protein HUJ06_005103 [Nelumbo nucifera]
MDGIRYYRWSHSHQKKKKKKANSFSFFWLEFFLCNIGGLGLFPFSFVLLHHSSTIPENNWG